MPTRTCPQCRQPRRLFHTANQCRACYDAARRVSDPAKGLMRSAGPPGPPVAILAPAITRPVEDTVSARPLPAEPTCHPPGSLEKIAVMEARYERGEHVHHPLDAREWVEVTVAESSTGEGDGDE